jgi:putative tryptophan/tyrosine transport system substrate-binding protein
MHRRNIIRLLAGAALAWPLAASAEQRVHAIGVLASQPLPAFENFVGKLRDYGYIEGENLRLHWRFAEGHDERYPELAAELISLPVELIVTQGTPASLAAKRATTTVPIVMGGIADPVSVGLVPNLGRPGGNVTGLSTQNVDLEGKRLELLKELLPHLSRTGVLGNVSNPVLAAQLDNLRGAAQVLRVGLEIFEVRSSADIGPALEKLQAARPDGVVVAADLLLMSNRTEIVTALMNSRLPAVYPFREYAIAGGLMVHGTNMRALFERTAGYVDRILKGTKPGELPIQLTTEFELIVNLKTAASMGLTIPPALISRADEVIE